jgi:hypothetical protein
MNSKNILGMVATLVTALALSSSVLAQEAAPAAEPAPAADSSAPADGGGGGGSSIITDGGVVDQWRLAGDLHMLFGFGGARAGLRVFADFPLHQFFMLGGEFNLAGGNGATQFQFDIKPTGRIPLKVGSGILEPYITAPMGLGLWTGGGSAAGFAWNVLFGAAYFFNDFIGVHGDFGVTGVTTGFGSGNAFALNLGAEFLF